MSCSCCHEEHHQSKAKEIFNFIAMISSIIIAFALEGVEIYYAFTNANTTMPI